jgi:hypothetical protein
MKKTLVVSASLLLLAGGLVLAAKPVENVSPHKHPNIAAAQELVRQAFQKVSAAQKANEWDMDGHAQKAKELLDQVNVELKQAAEAANHHAK